MGPILSAAEWQIAGKILASSWQVVGMERDEINKREMGNLNCVAGGDHFGAAAHRLSL